MSDPFTKMRHPEEAPRTFTTRRYLAIAVLLAGGLTVAGCAGSSSPTETSDGELVWGKATEVVSLDPTFANSAVSWEILNLVYERLVGIDENLQVVPALAESWEQTGPTTYKFKLREGVEFSNGRLLTAEDVKGTLDRVMDPDLGSGLANQLGIESVTVDGDSELTVELKAPKTAFLAALADTRASILPIEELESGELDPTKDLLGTGPFVVEEHSLGESWDLVANEAYWQEGVPKYENLTVRIMPEDSARIAALREGSIDVATFDNPDASQLLEGQENVELAVQGTTDYYRMDINALSSVFTDERLREAIALSLDRDRIADLALGGVGAATAAVPPAFGGLCDPAGVPFGAQDIERASELVAEAGAEGQTVKLMISPGIANSAGMAQVIEEDIEKTGLDVQIETLDFATYVEHAEAGEFDFLLSWSAGFADPVMTLLKWNPDLVPFTRAFMAPDAELAGLLDTAQVTPPSAERDEALQGICDRAAETANMVPLVTKDVSIAYRSDAVTPVIRKYEGYGSPLRNIGEYELTQ